MTIETCVELKTPPLPYYWESGRTVFQASDRHPNRRQFGLFDLLFVASGGLHIGENGEEWSLGEGDTLLLLPEGEHYAVKPCERETVFYWVHFEHSAWQQGPPAPLVDLPEPQSPFDHPKSIRIPKHASLPNPMLAFELLQRLIELPVGDCFWEKQHLLTRLLAMLEDVSSAVAANSPPARLAEKAAAYLQQHYREDMTNEKLAEALHFHPNYVVRCMKMKYGMTPVHYLLQFRMERAKQLLVSTEWSIDRIAEEVGFRYSPYFSACFKRSIGITPLRYRKQYLV
ncbi:AraC family transcriptional regulator [Paenibacillus rhizovicinus]|uniref:AraC family transcriptional regulator n=1 Tax=Paenibacillus rhizovicinus TaxID=2704463 RepID=A0A6C0NZ75_9BACL|nr:helix-turn-helix domain-containing protein [Paenibacillus rhizovicinus]QHW30993.1 AraC family transcriptional regulator [Paenibacillus rhizovicinus]